jgi:hypothetical protein
MMLKYPQQIGQPPVQKSNTGIAAAVFGSLVALGGAAAVAYASRSKPQPRLGRTPIARKKPCGCGR